MRDLLIAKVERIDPTSEDAFVTLNSESGQVVAALARIPTVVVGGGDPNNGLVQACGFVIDFGEVPSGAEFVEFGWKWTSGSGSVARPSAKGMCAVQVEVPMPKMPGDIR